MMMYDWKKVIDFACTPPEFFPPAEKKSSPDLKHYSYENYTVWGRLFES